MATSIPFVRESTEAVTILKQLLRSAGIAVTAEDTTEYGVKLYASFRDASFALVLYFTRKTGRSSKVVLERETEGIRRAVVSALDAPPAAVDSSIGDPMLDDVRGRGHIGIDESGKGDYFGPLVIAGVYVKPDDELGLTERGVKDSKLLSDRQVAIVADKVRSLLGSQRYDLVCVNPEKYNELYVKMRNLNKLLAWGHARVLENLLHRNDCDLAVCDQFGDENYIRNALMEKGKSVTLIQTPKGERDVAVAAASILARDTFVRKLGELSRRYGVTFPKGAFAVVEVARDFVRASGRTDLAKVAKLHFKTTTSVLKEV